MGLKIAATDLENAVAGSSMYLCNTEEEEKEALTHLKEDFDQIQKKVKLDKLGVGVAASTLGSLEALIQFLQSEKIPIAYISVGPVSKEDIVKALKSVLADNPQ